MKKELFNYQFNKHYSLQKINIYAYSFFATKILIKNEITDDFSVDLDSIISHISDSLVDNTNTELVNLRNENHDNYYKINIKFLMNIDKRYKKIADKILNSYTKIDAKEILNDDMDDAIARQKAIKLINLSIEKLREKMQDDLLVIMNFVDEEESKLDKSFLKEDNIIANKLKKHYNALLLHKSVINMDNLNLEMKRQKTRLGIINKLKPLIDDYNKNIESYSKKEYQVDDILILRKNLSIILGEYIFLLTHQEFHDVRKVYQGILDDDYSFVDDFLYTYKIIMNKVWRYMITPLDEYHFDFYYLVCMQDNLENDVSVGLMNRYNMHCYKNLGYICNIDDNIFDVLDVSKYELLNIKLPHEIEEKCEFKINDPDKITVSAMYNKGNKQIYNEQYDVIDIR
jgi:hypothetical protein